MPIVFSAISPHPPIILLNVGSEKDRQQVKKTIDSLKLLGKKLCLTESSTIIISSPHEDWGFNVPLFFLAKDFKGEIKKVLIGLESPQFYFEEKVFILYIISPTAMSLIVEFLPTAVTERPAGCKFTPISSTDKMMKNAHISILGDFNKSLGTSNKKDTTIKGAMIRELK